MGNKKGFIACEDKIAYFVIYELVMGSNQKIEIVVVLMRMVYGKRVFDLFIEFTFSIDC